MTRINLICLIYFLTILPESYQSRIVIESITIRHMRKNDIGLIFDAVISNKPSEPQEMLNFEIRSEQCCLLINSPYDCDTQNLIGVKVSNLESNKKIIATILWPTLIPYNRIGNCTVNVVTHRPLGTQIDDTKLIHFNTTIDPEKLPDYMMYYFNDMKSKFGYSKCESVDLNPFNKCKPLNCELKYFGRRNFFNFPFCVPAVTCENDPYIVYDYETNTCRSLNKIFSDDDLKKLKSGIFDNWVLSYDGVDKDENSTVEKMNKHDRILRRARRSLNESQTFTDMMLSSLLFIIKIAVLIIFVYLMMALLISVLFYLCIGCGIISNSVTTNVFERFE